MDDKRWDAYERQVLGGEPIPDDLRILLTEQWAGREQPLAAHGVVLREPGSPDPLADVGYLSPEERANPDIASHCAANERMGDCLRIVAQDEDSNAFGYWHHPDRPAGSPVAVVKWDSEGIYWTLPGRTLTEALLAELAFGDDEAFVRLAAELAPLGVSVGAERLADLAEPAAEPAPEVVHRRFYDEERRKRGLAA